MKKGEMLTNIYLNFILVIVYYEENSGKYQIRKHIIQKEREDRLRNLDF